MAAHAAADSSTDAPLGSLRAIRALTHQDAAREPSVAFEATVTYFRAYEKTLFVQDGDDAIYVQAATSLPLVAGDRVLIRGTVRDSFRPIVKSSDVTLLHPGKLPAATPASYSAMIRSEFDCRFVSVRGKVRSANMSLSSGRSVTALELTMDGGTVGISLDSDDPARLQGLLDAAVEITGVVSGRFDGKMQQTGLLIHAAGFDQVRILERAPVDAWSIPITPMDQVLRSSYSIDQSQRVRVAGIITYYHPMSMAVLQDGSRNIRVLTPSIPHLRVGDGAEAIGIPFVDNGFLTLKLGEIRSTGPADPVLPRPVDWDQLASGKYAFDLVSLEGAVVTQVREHAQDIYIISSGGHLFSATVRHPFVYEWNVRKDPPPMPEIHPGSRVRVTGVAILDDGNPFNGAMAFGILLRSAEDVAVLAQPPWLDVRHLMEIVSGLLLMVILISAWGAMLRRKVRRQTAALAKRIEAETVLERRRSAILEDINANCPLTEILEQITDLVSFSLNGAQCWLQIANAAPVGNCPSSLPKQQVMRQEIRSRSGPLQGTLSVVLDPASPRRANAADALYMGAGLTTLAIDTHGLYSDLIHRSEFDLLTDIPNRFSLEKHLGTILEDARQQNGCVGLVYIDLDEFKQVNDRYGHHIGDLFLQQVAERMKRQLRPGDTLARLGGDEFAAVVTRVRGRADVEEIATRLERCFNEPFSLDGYPLRGSASLGIAVFPENGGTHDALLSAADSAMYAAKHRKRQMEAALRTG